MATGLTLQSTISLDGDVYRACIICQNVTLEARKMFRTFGPLQVQVGGTISGSATRMGQNPVVVTVTPTDGDTPSIIAVITANVNTDGTIAGFVVTNPGLGYNHIPTLSVTQTFTTGAVGTGATVLAAVSGGVVVSATLQTAGSGYFQVPTPTSFTLPYQVINVPDNLPVSYAADTRDFSDADVRVAVWTNTVLGLIQDAYTAQMDTTTSFLGTTVTTIS